MLFLFISLLLFVIIQNVYCTCRTQKTNKYLLISFFFGCESVMPFTCVHVCKIEFMHIIFENNKKLYMTRHFKLCVIIFNNLYVNLNEAWSEFTGTFEIASGTHILCVCIMIKCKFLSIDCNFWRMSCIFNVLNQKKRGICSKIVTVDHLFLYPFEK